MAMFFIRLIVKIGLWFRYRIRVKGLDEVLKKGHKGILFMPNHPALIDPVIVSAVLNKHFRPRPLVDVKQVETTALKYIKDTIGVLPMPVIGIVGNAGREKVLEQINECVKALKNGDNVLFYPAGRLYRSRYEKLRANGGLEYILSAYPDVRIVLVRTTGLWGSSFGRCRGYQPSFGSALKSHIKHVLGNFLFFTPRRNVTVEVLDAPAEFPRTGTRDAMNRWLEAFYNETSTPNTYVPYGWWEKGTTREMPEPDSETVVANTKDVPPEIRQAVIDKLRELTPIKDIQENQTLGTDLGLDSLMVTELQTWIQDEFGQNVNNPETLVTVGSLMLAAIGVSETVQPLKDIPKQWFRPADPTERFFPEGDTITGIFLNCAKQRPNFMLMADQLAGGLTYKKIILAVMVLKKLIEKIPGERIGLIMPACAAENVVYLAILFSGKTPVLLNWTVGLRNLKHCIKQAEVESILTSRAVIDGLEGRGTDFTGIKEQFIYLEELKKKASKFSLICSLLASKFCWRSLRKAHVPEVCAVLFTSGSESLPKAVPVTHKNILTDARSAMNGFKLQNDDIILGMLPPFHSFGVLIGTIMPLCGGIRLVYHANPTEGEMIARLIAAYGATMTIGTPTFIHNILRNATDEQVHTIRIAITGAEKCPQQTYDLIQKKCKNVWLLEGYGITECTPIVAVNKPGFVKIGSLGKIMDCMKWTIRDEQMRPVPPNETGMLYVKGDNVFSGYLNYDGPSPFVDIDGETYYRTGDLVSADEEGFIFFKGRKKRFVKIAGEMVSLPAIEDVLMAAFKKPDDDLPLAVEALGTEEKPEVTLFTTLDLTRDEVNLKIREAGLSPIHSIKNIRKLDAIPVLGTGKTDYRTLKTL